jgi:hypothetical protein
MNGRKSSSQQGSHSWRSPKEYKPASRSRALVPAREYDGGGRRAPGWLSASGRICLRAALAVLILFGIGFGALYARLSHSPISLSFVVPPIEEAVNSSLNGMSFEIGDAVLQRSPTHPLGIEFRLAGVRLLDTDGDAIAESPFASGGFSLAALFSGRLAPSHIELIGPKLYVHFSEENGLALSFSEPVENPVTPAVAPERESKSARGVDQPTQVLQGQRIVGEEQAGLIRQARGRAVNLSKALKQLFQRSRSGQSAYLNTFGITDALVYFDRDGQITRWQLASVEVDLSHSQGESEITGEAEIRTQAETFELKFGAEQNRNTGQISLNLGVDDLVPRAFTQDFPSLKLPDMWGMPVSLSARMDLGDNGDILTGDIWGNLKSGEFFAPWEKVHSANIDEGSLHLTYSREDGLIRLAKSELIWGESRIRMSGFMKRQPQTGRWAFNFSADELVLGARQFGLPVIPLDHMSAEGNYDPAIGRITLDRYILQAADAYIALAGEITQGRRSPAIRMAGQVSAMPIAFFKLIWPKFIAYSAREWVGERMPTGRIAGGTLNVDIPADLLASLDSGGSLPPETVDFQLDLRDVQMHYIRDLPPMQIEQAKMRVAGQRFFFNAPKGEVIAPSGEAIQFSEGQFIVGDLRPFIPEGEIHFKSESSASAVLSLLDHPKLGYVSKLNLPIPQVDAKASSAFSISLTLIKDLKFEHMRMNGRTVLENVRASNLPGGFGVHDGNLAFDVTSEGLDAEGELSMNGMPVLVGWRYLFKTPLQHQPPLKLRTVLDAKAREEIGIEASHVLRGPIPAEITVNFQENAPPVIGLRLNLKDAEITAGTIGWTKPAGVDAAMVLDMEPVGDGAMELRDINLQGEDFNVQGAVRLNGEKKPVAFNLPVVALGAQTQLQIRGDLTDENVWKVHIRGASFDGREMFRTLLSTGKAAPPGAQPPADAPGLDFDAEIGRITGYFDTTLETVKLTASRRGNALVALDVHGQLNGDRPFAARVEQKSGESRQLVAQATDAGAAFRLVGFYPSARGGEASLSVNLDEGRNKQRIGSLFAQNFVIVNDEVVSEVLSSAQASARPSGQPLLQFDRMQVQFAIGGGRFIVRDALINGPVLGATVRGSIDFASESISLSGTYVPLYGINGALGFLPILGDLLVSRSGEGLFGITFAVRGKTSKPDVLVNPVSLVAPGFLRQIFEFNEPPQQQGRNQQQPPSEGVRGLPRASSQPPSTQ